MQVNKTTVVSVMVGVAAVGALYYGIRKLPANSVTDVVKKAAEVTKG